MYKSHPSEGKRAALTAIVQTMLREQYWEPDEEEGKRRFLRLAEADDPVALAILNELSAEELDEAFRWTSGGGRDGARRLAPAPVLDWLSETQYERVRVAAVAEDEMDRARELVAGTRGASPATSDRVRRAEACFVEAMCQDLHARRGETAWLPAGDNVEARIDAMPEPWRSRTRRELERLRADLAGGLQPVGGGER